MSAKILYRIAAVLLLLFAIGHTIGFLKFEAPTREGVAVFEGMQNVHFDVNGKPLSYGMFYEGFGLFATVYLVFAMVLAWQLSSVASTAPKTFAGIAWAFFVLHAVSTALCWKYFLVPPLVLSALTSIFTGWAAWILSRA